MSFISQVLLVLARHSHEHQSFGLNEPPCHPFMEVVGFRSPTCKQLNGTKESDSCFAPWLSLISTGNRNKWFSMPVPRRGDLGAQCRAGSL